jgi:hypothetical protein
MMRFIKFGSFDRAVGAAFDLCYFDHCKSVLKKPEDNTGNMI